MTFVRIIEWILLKLWNEYCLNCFINIGENRMHIKANLSNFATSLSNVLNKIKYIWILLSICGNYQTHIRDVECWHISATISHVAQNRHAWEQETYWVKKNKKNDHVKWCKVFVCLVSVRPLPREWLAAKRLLGSLMSHVSVMVALVSDAMWYTSYILTQK